MPGHAGRHPGIAVAAILVALAAAGGCAHHHVVAHTGDPVDTVSNNETHNQFFWGLVGEPTIYVQDCASHALHDVEVSTTFWQGLATVVTLGIWMPATVEWRCATVAEQTFDAPIPGDPASEDADDARR